jgi:hypothetical protein
MRSCERLSFAAATIFMALVIFCVFLNAAILRRKLCKLGIVFHQICGLSAEVTDQVPCRPSQP